MSNSPSVSVVTPTYNSAEYIQRCLQSIDSQTFPHSELEHIIVDDGSTDNTVSIVNKQGANYVRILEKEHTGATRSLNYGIRHSKGQYVVILDSDDEFEPTLIEKMYIILSSNPDIDFVYSDYWENPVKGEKFRVHTKDNLMNLITIGIMHRKEVLKEMDYFNPDMYFSEYDLLLRYVQSGREGHHINEPLFTYHRRPDSQTGSADWIDKGNQELEKKFDMNLTIRDY